MNLLPDPVPLGVAGVVTVPRSLFLASETPDNPAAPLLDDDSRLALLAESVRHALAQPLLGTRQLSELILGAENPARLYSSFAEKMLMTLRDGKRHDCTILVSSTPRFAFMFAAWNGTHYEVQAERYGNYLPVLMKTISFLADMADSIAGFLEINAFVRDEPDPAHPMIAPEQTLEIDIEYAYIPGGLIPGVGVKSPLAPQDVVLNGDLMSPEQRRALAG